MKNIFIILIVLTLVNDLYTQTEIPLPKRELKIEKGDHNSKFKIPIIGWIYCIPDPNTQLSFPSRTLKFKVNFQESCLYGLEHNNHVNKVMKLSWVLPWSDVESIRVGWRPETIENPQKIVVYMYNHWLEETYYMPIDTVNVNVETSEFKHTYRFDGFYLRYESRGVAMKRNIFPPLFPPVTEVTRNSYFGGSATAPHDIYLTVSDIETDSPFDWFEQTDEKFFANSIFNGTEIVYADTRIEAAVPIQYISKDEKTKEALNYTIIKSEADVTFEAGHIIVLHPGFKVEDGANFHAKITNKNKSQNITNEDMNKYSSYLIKGNDIQKYLKIFPNPNKGIFTIQFISSDNQNWSTCIYNSFGNQVRFFDNISTDKIEIDITSLEKGIYIIVVSTSSQHYIEKISFI
jgi:hypothetical protein